MCTSLSLSLPPAFRRPATLASCRLGLAQLAVDWRSLRAMCTRKGAAVTAVGPLGTAVCAYNGSASNGCALFCSNLRAEPSDALGPKPMALFPF